MKKTLALVLAIVMMLSAAFAVWAEDAPATDAPVYATEPEADVAYKLVVEQGNVGKTLYLTGKTANYDYYLASTENIDEAVDVYVEVVDGGYKLYFTLDDVKTYITFKQSGTHYNTGLVTSADEAAVLAWDTTYNTFTATVADGTVVYLGMYNTYKTFSASKYSYINGSFPSHLLKVEVEAPETEAPTTEAPTTEAPVEPPVDEPVVEAETIQLYKGEPNKGGQYTNSINAANKFGQKFTVPEGKILAALDFAQIFTYGDGNVNKGALTIWAWDTDYATTTAAEALCVVDLVNVADNSPLSIAIDAKNLTGELFYEISYLEGTKTYAPCTAGGNADGVVSYYNGKENAGNMWGGGTGIACAIGVLPDPNYVPETPHEHNFVDGKCECGEEDPNYEPPVVVEEEVIKLYNGDPVANMAAKTWETKFGQIFTVPEGKEMTKITLGFQAVDDPDGNGKPDANAIIKIWAWNTDYATTVSAEPLVVIEQNVGSGDNEFVLETALTGKLFWEAHAEEGERLAPSGATQKAEGVINVIDGVENAACTGWSGANTIRAAITVVADPDYVPHEHNFVDGKCECGETDPNYVPPHEHEFVDGKCECGEEDPNYEAPTEAPTDEVTTEAPTEAPTDEVTTEAPTDVATDVATDAATDAATTAAATTAAATTAAEKSGCGSVVGSAVAVAVIAIAGAAAVVLKKKED